MKKEAKEKNPVPEIDGRRWLYKKVREEGEVSRYRAEQEKIEKEDKGKFGQKKMEKLPSAVDLHQEDAHDDKKKE